MAKISDFVIGMILVGVIISGFVMVMGSMNTYYGTPTGYDSSKLSSFQESVDNLSVYTEEIKNETEKASEKSGVLDVIGDFFSAGYKAAKLSAKSVNVFEDFVNQGMTNIGLGAFGEILKTAIISIVLIIIFVGILMRALIKSDI